MPSLHTLKVKSLRDLEAAFSCGHGTLTAPTFDWQTDAELRQIAGWEHPKHTKEAKQ